MFDPKAYLAAPVITRVARVELPGLKHWVTEDEEGDNTPYIEVRGLTAVEMCKAMEAQETNKNLDGVIKAIGHNEEQIAAMKKAVGLGDNVPNEVAKRLTQLSLGSVRPKLELDACVRLGEDFPVELWILTNKITELTGLGKDIAK